MGLTLTAKGEVVSVRGKLYPSPYILLAMVLKTVTNSSTFERGRKIQFFVYKYSRFASFSYFSEQLNFLGLLKLTMFILNTQ